MSLITLMLNLTWIFSTPTVRTPRELAALNTTTYISAVVLGILFLGIAAIVAKLITYESGARPTDPRRRRIWFWSLLGFAVTVFFFYNQFSVMPGVAGNLKARFMSTMGIATGVLVVSYLALGFIIAKGFPKSKFGNWFPSRK